MHEHEKMYFEEHSRKTRGEKYFLYPDYNVIATL